MEFVGEGEWCSEKQKFRILAGKLQILALSRNKSVAVNVRDSTRSEEICLLRVQDSR